jgi:hypothetical protein
MNVDSRDGRDDFSLGWVKQQLQALSGVEPPRGLKERLLAAVPCPAAREASSRHTWLWPRATSWVGVAATVLVVCGIVWLRTPAGPSVRSSADANSGQGRVLAADYNSVRPPDTNALDSNGLY